MGSKKQKEKDKFPDELMREWENSDGVNFAIALARASGWLLQVDWSARSQDDPVEQMKSLRVYVATDGEAVYDFNGRKLFQAYNQYVITPIAQKRQYAGAGILSRFYSEEKLWKLPLRVKPSEAGIVRAEEALRNYPAFMNKMPKRINPHVPAHLAAAFTFSRCAVFAAANQAIKGLPATAISVSRYAPFAMGKIGFCHSVNVHPDGEWEDAWGKQPSENILNRYGIEAYSLSEPVQQEVVAKLSKNSPELYKEYYHLAEELIGSFQLHGK
ncbi:hypothetical protein KXD93_04645 [Mucilaginibacter sp. BJC16-A38]|uniref:hypothetical protein n=1 Tax=Mucilaginibacter phenanthrenivorans TaxID=1234842 RepID=UPI0021586CCE|nr:hypothetical protein [Mucilaginibacter phenanthrenivorans]MCR8556914.1 hypothetical protein [Mucilaginibacter phenanthrenivorans]